MKESYSEGLAIHAGPESCGAAREGGVEAQGLLQLEEGSCARQRREWREEAWPKGTCPSVSGL